MTVKMMTAALATSAFVMGSGLALAQSPQTPPQPSPRPQTEQPRTAGTQTSEQNTMNEIVLQGCVARDDSSSAAGRSGATAGAAATAASGGTTFVLKNAKKQDAQSATSAQRGQTTAGSSAQGTASQSSTTAQQSARASSSSSGMGDENTYRLMARGASVNLTEHVGHQIEVRGRMLEASMSTRGTATGETKQTAQAGQTGQADQRTGGAYGAGAGSDQHKSVIVSSVRMISQTCGTSK